MEIRDVSSLAAGAHDVGDGATVTPLYPSAAWGQGLVAVDLWEIAPGGSISGHAHPEEHILFVLSGQGRLQGEKQDGVVAAIRENTVIYLSPNEGHQVRNTGNAPLRLLVSTPLLVRSERAHGVATGRQSSQGAVMGATQPDAPPAEAPSRIAERPAAAESAPSPARSSRKSAPEPTPEPPAPSEPDSPEGEQAPANIEGMMRRASELKDQPKSERRRPAPPPDEAPQPEAQEQSQPEEEAEEQSNLMELFVVFDGDIRGGTAQGFGRYLVQSPGRKPVVKAVEFDANYTPALAQYESLVEALRYIVARLEATGRNAKQVQLDIRADNESVVNGLLGTMKVREPALRKRQEQALELLGDFADWRIEWHSPEESERLFA